MCFNQNVGAAIFIIKSTENDAKSYATFFSLNSVCSVEQRDLKNFAQFGYFLLSFEIGIKQHNITI